jgi:ABC-type multidrug transport system fused ATPase/permease subunit
VIIRLPPQFLSILVALVITFSIKPILSFILIAGVAAYALILSKITPPMIKLQQLMHHSYNQAYGDAFDILQNIQAVKQATAEDYEKINLYKKFRLKAFQFWNEMNQIWQSIGFYQRLIVTFTQLTIFILSIIYITQGKMTIGELIMFNGYAAMFFGPFVVLGDNWQTIQNGLIALERGEKILTLPEEKYAPENAVLLSDLKGEVVFENISFSYNKGKDVLLDISFKVNPGEIIALVGKSGVGKSTLIDLLGGYYFPQSGQILIDGQNIKNIDLKFLRNKIAIVPQEVVLFNDTIKNNIRYGNFSASDKEVIEAAKKAYAREFIENFPEKYDQIVGERGIKLSVGQKQRMAIARAILRNPRILILDEPTSALDAHSEKHIQESLETLMNGRTTFIIAHRLSTVRKADKILVLEKGRIAESGKHDELIKIPNGIYRKFYELQIGLYS